MLAFLLPLVVCAGCHGAGPDAPDCAPPEIEGCRVDRTTGDRACTLEHDGVERSYRLVLPETAGCASTPLVFDVHGLTSNPAQQEWISGFDDLARSEGFVVAMPEGSGEIRSWNAGTCCGVAAVQEVDDVGFLDAIRERLEASMTIDPRRVYVTGLSNGGYLTHRLACERADVYAAVAPVAGVLGVSECASTRPVPLLQFHGTDDQLVPYGGEGMGGGLSAPATIAWWVGRNDCDPTPTVTFDEGDVTCERFAGCAGGADVELCTVQGGGHTWPGGPDLLVPALGRTTMDIDATQTIWAFFLAHPVPEPTADWTPRTGPEVDEPAPTDTCGIEEPAASAPRNDLRLVLPDDENAPPAATGGDPSGRWVIEAADLFLPPIAIEEVVTADSRVEAAGRLELDEDGRFALVLDLDGRVVTTSYGVLRLRRRARTTGEWQVSGTELTLSPDCGELGGLPGQSTGNADFSRIDEDHARIAWLLSSGLIGDVTFVANLSRLE